ncbi:hypothetical protein D3C87_762560 [compost metagenome]
MNYKLRLICKYAAYLNLLIMWLLLLSLISSIIVILVKIKLSSLIIGMIVYSPFALFLIPIFLVLYLSLISMSDTQKFIHHTILMSELEQFIECLKNKRPQYKIKVSCYHNNGLFKAVTKTLKNDVDLTLHNIEYVSDIEEEHFKCSIPDISLVTIDIPQELLCYLKYSSNVIELNEILNKRKRYVKVIFDYNFSLHNKEELERIKMIEQSMISTGKALDEKVDIETKIKYKNSKRMFLVDTSNCDYPQFNNTIYNYISIVGLHWLYSLYLHFNSDIYNVKVNCVI